MKTTQIKTVREQIQEDLLCLFESAAIDLSMTPTDYEKFKTSACQLVVDNFKKLENENIK